MNYFRLIILNSILVLISSFNLDLNQELKSSINTNYSHLPNFDCDTTFTVDSLTSISQLKEIFRLYTKNDLSKNQRYFRVVVSSKELYFKFAFKSSQISIKNSHTFILDEHLLMSSNLLRTSLLKWMNKHKVEIEFNKIPSDKTSSLIWVENNDFCVTKLIDFQKIYEDVFNRYSQANKMFSNIKNKENQSKIKRLSNLIYEIVTLS